MKLEVQFEKVFSLIDQARQRAYTAVNTELINLYIELGHFLSVQIATENWGKGVVEELATYLKSKDPEIKGFSSQNLWRMRQFYEAYRKDEQLLAYVKELSWTNNLLILSKCKSRIEREFYLKLSIKEKYSSRELGRQLDSGVYERVLLGEPKLSAAMREIHPTAENLLKDKYVLDFMALPESFSEKDLRKGIIQHLKHFILEFGKDFSFVGEEFRVQVGTKDFYVDLLFYHRELRCLVALDLKITDFKPEYLGKMDFYLEALDQTVKKAHEKPSVGIVLCKSKDEEVVKFALSRSISPTMVSEYETKLIPKDILKRKMAMYYDLLEK